MKYIVSEREFSNHISEIITSIVVDADDPVKALEMAFASGQIAPTMPANCGYSINPIKDN